LHNFESQSTSVCQKYIQEVNEYDGLFIADAQTLTDHSWLFWIFYLRVLSPNALFTYFSFTV